MKRLLILALTLILGCTTSTTQTAPVAGGAAPAGAPTFKNLQVFPRDIQRPQLIAAMKGFTRGLGVRCNHCHVVTATEPKEEFDFPSDVKEEKRVARVMIRMAAEINGTWLPRVEAAEGHVEAAGRPQMDNPPRVSCWTCHRGETEPAMPPPAPAG